MAYVDRTQILESTQFHVRDLLRCASEGRLRLPAFQRGLRWQREDNRKLFDSLYRGYPVGNLLFWKRKAQAARLQFGRVVIEAPAHLDAYWIVDGQQRLTALIAGLLGPDPALNPGVDPFALWFDLDEGVVVTRAPRDSKRFVPLSALRSAQETQRWANRMGVGEGRSDQAQGVGERLRDYRIPAYITDTQDETVLRSIFDRVNSSGRQLRMAEVFQALNVALDSEVGAGKNPAGTLDTRLQAVPLSLGFGPVRAEILQRALFAVAGFEPGKSIPDQLRAPQAALQHERATAAALDTTIRFLMDEAGFLHSQMLPYELPLLILPRFFHLHPQPKERSIELLVRWVARGAAGQVHSATNQQINPVYQAVRERNDEEDTVQRILNTAPRSRPEHLPLPDVFNPRGMKTHLALAAMMDLKPRSLVHGRLLAPSEALAVGSSTEEPQPGRATNPSQERPDLLRLPVRAGALVRHTATALLHPRTDSGEDPHTLLTRLQQAPEDVLASHALRGEGAAAARRGDWGAAVEHRKAELDRVVTSALLRRAQWGADDDGPSLDHTLPADGA